MFDFHSKPTFKNRSCGECNRSGILHHAVIEGKAPACTACSGHGIVYSVRCPDGTWLPTETWRKSPEGALFFEIQAQGVELTWDDLYGACGYLFAEAAEEELAGIRSSLAAIGLAP